VVGPYGNGRPNDNSDRLTMLCDMHDLTILGSWFKRLDIHRMTWISHNGTTRKEIHHVITRHREKGLFHSCRVYRGAEAPANSNHVLLVAELCIPILKRKRHQAAAIRFDVARLSVGVERRLWSQIID